MPQVRSNGLIVFVPKYGIEGPVYLDDAAATAAAAGADGGSSGSGAGAGGSSGSGKARRGVGAAPPADSQYVYDEEKQTVHSRDGRLAFTVFDPCAVRICVEEAAGNRRTLVLRLVDRGELPDSERMH